MTKMDQEQAKRIIEALLFASERPLGITQIKETLEELDAQTIKMIVEKLQSEYKDSGRSFNIVPVAGGYQVSTDPVYAPWLSKLYRNWRAEKLSHPALETLAIIAYRQPITRQEVEDIRGVNIEGVLKTILERSLVRISGRKKIPGRPFLYSTTRKFLEFFGLQSLEELPKLEEFEETKLMFQSQEAFHIKTEKGVDNSGGKEDGETKEITQKD
jgi:segregation and condensation protein B